MNIKKFEAMDKGKKNKLALKYQIFTDYTSLFAEVELSEKISEEMKKQIIGDEEHNVIDMDEFRPKIEDQEKILYNILKMKEEMKRQMEQIHCVGCACSNIESFEDKLTYSSAPKKSSGVKGFFKSIGSSIKGLFTKKR